MRAVERVWGKRVQRAEPTPAETKIENKPVLEAKAIETQTDIQTGEQERVQAQYLHVPVKNHDRSQSVPLWMLIVVSAAAGLFLLWAMAASWQARRAFEAQARILDHLLALAAPAVRAPRESLEKLLAELQS